MTKVLKTSLIATAAIALPATIFAGIALNDAAWAEGDQKNTLNPDWMPIQEVLTKLSTEGYSGFVEFELEEGAYEIEGRDATGQLVELMVDPSNGLVLEVDVEN